MLTANQKAVSVINPTLSGLCSNLMFPFHKMCDSWVQSFCSLCNGVSTNIHAGKKNKIEIYTHIQSVSAPFQSPQRWTLSGPPQTWAAPLSSERRNSRPASYLSQRPGTRWLSHGDSLINKDGRRQ